MQDGSFFMRTRRQGDFSGGAAAALGAADRVDGSPLSDRRLARGFLLLTQYASRAGEQVRLHLPYSIAQNSFLALHDLF